MDDSDMMRRLADKAGRGEGIGRDEIRWVLEQSDPARIGEICAAASAVRAKFLGNQACIHGIIEMSNICRRNCLYCGVRRDNRAVARYRLEPERIIELGAAAVKRFGYKMLVLQSGEDLYYTTGMLASVIKEITRQCGALIFLSIGERDETTYQKLYLAGARGTLFRFETSSPALYAKMHPGASFDERVAHLRFMKDIGYIVAAGPLIGLPGQTLETLADDIAFVRDLGALMVSTGPFIPHPLTPLAGSPVVPASLVRKAIAAARLAMPRVRIPVTTAMEHLWGDGFRRDALRSGANSFMLNLTPDDVRDRYDIYPDKNKRAECLHSAAAFAGVNAIIEECGMKLCRGFGIEFPVTDAAFAAGCSMDRT